MGTFWSVARSQPQHEAFAAQWIGTAGFEVFLPKIAAKGGAVLPMFRGYLFVDLDGHAWQRVDRCPGVISLVRFGDTPARCPDAEITALKARADANGIIRLPPPPSKRGRVYVKGEAVKIVAGPFCGLAGVHSGMSMRERELVLITMLGAQRAVAIARDFVTPQ